jgi:hypothetical protein
MMLELRLATGVGSELDVGGARELARRRDERAGGSPIAETRALAALGAARALVADDAAWPGLPRATASDAAGRLEIISHVDGADLGILLRRGRWRRGDPDLAVSLAGEWLGRFERIPLPPAGVPAHREDSAARERDSAARERDSAARERDAITARILHEAEADARRCVEQGLAEPLVDRALQLCLKELREGLLLAPCWSHGSLAPENLIVSGLDMLFDGIEAQLPRPGGHRRVTAIGLGGLRPGMPGEDAATFLESLAILVPGLASLGLLRARRHELEDVFLEGRRGMRPSVPTPALRAAKLLAIAARASLPAGALRRRFLLLRLSTRILELTT